MGLQVGTMIYPQPSWITRGFLDVQKPWPVVTNKSLATMGTTCQRFDVFVACYGHVVEVTKVQGVEEIIGG